jgi:hypothetical protein
VRLLPTPVLSFTNIRVGEADAPDVEMERFRAEVELAPLLKGEVRVIQMTVERPRFRVDLAALAEPQSEGTPGGWRIDAERISLARLEIIEGSADVADSRAGRSWRAENLRGVIEATSLHGPGRISADLVFDGTPITVQAGLGRINPDNTVATNVRLGSPDFPCRWRSTVRWRSGAPPRRNIPASPHWPACCRRRMTSPARHGPTSAPSEISR